MPSSEIRKVKPSWFVRALGPLLAARAARHRLSSRRSICARPLPTRSMNISWRARPRRPPDRRRCRQRAEALHPHAPLFAQLGEQRVERVDVAGGRGILDARALHLLHQERGNSIAVLFSAPMSTPRSDSDTTRASADRAACDTPRSRGWPIASRCASARRRPPRSGPGAPASAPSDTRRRAPVSSSANCAGR